MKVWGYCSSCGKIVQFDIIDNEGIFPHPSIPCITCSECNTDFRLDFFPIGVKQ